MAFSCRSSDSACETKASIACGQCTLGDEVSLTGIGLFTGEKVKIRLYPAPPGTGIVFKRVDLPGSPVLPAKLSYIQGTPRCTMIGHQGVHVQTIEHLLAALSAYKINNLIIEISGSEVPICDGSSLAFVDMIEEVGVRQQSDQQPVYKLSSPVFWSQGNIHLVALPSEEYRISYTLHYPQSSLLRSQYYSVLINEENFKKEIAPSRTFSLYEEIAPLAEKGLFKGGSLENAVIIKEDRVVNPEGLRFPDEMVRHKILDVLGDLSLIAVPFLAHIIAIRSGHASNNEFAKILINHLKLE